MSDPEKKNRRPSPRAWWLLACWICLCSGLTGGVFLGAHLMAKEFKRHAEWSAYDSWWPFNIFLERPDSVPPKESRPPSSRPTK